MRVLVLGGHGYVGSHVTYSLNQQGIEAVPYGSRTHDYRNLGQDYFTPFDAVIVLAGHSSVPSCKGDLKGPWNNNVRNLVELIDKLDPSKLVIYASSSSVYGNTGYSVATEDNLCASFMNNYDLTKTAGDQYVLNYINKGRRLVGLRFGTVSGPAPVIRTELLLNSMTYSAVINQKINITNGKIMRPFLNIDDLSKAMVAVLNCPVPGIYNLATGNLSISQYAKAVQRVTGVEIVDHGNTPGVYDFMISSEKFKSTYNFEFDNSVYSTVVSLVDTYTNRDNKYGVPILVNRNQYFDYQ